jgi:hypothetical protein
VEILVAPPPLDCTYDLDFVAAVGLGNGVSISFDAPFDVPNQTMDSARNVNLGDKLIVSVNSSEVADYSAGVYAPDRPNRLFIILPELEINDDIQIQLQDGETLYCSQTVVVDWIDPYITPTKVQEEKCEPTQYCMYGWNYDKCCCAQSGFPDRCE